MVAQQHSIRLDLLASLFFLLPPLLIYFVSILSISIHHSNHIIDLPRPTLPGYIPDPFAVVSSPPSKSINSVDASPQKVKQEPFSKDDPFASSYTQPPAFPQSKPTVESNTNKPQPPLPTHSTSPSMDYTSDDPWGTPDLHKDHHHEGSVPTATTVAGAADAADIPSSAAPIVTPEPVPAPVGTASEPAGSNGLFGSSPTEPSSVLPIRTTSTFTTTPAATVAGGGSIGGGSANGSLQGGSGATVSSPRASAASGGWDVYGGGFGSNNLGLNGDLSRQPVSTSAQRAIGGIAVGGARTAPAVEEYVLVTLLPEKEGLFMFQHHNYEVSSQRRGSKVVRRYSDFVWLLECLNKRYPFRVLPLLPPKRVALNGNHLSNDGAFIEKRRRGLARFLNALVRHPVISTEQLVVMFLTVPTELSVWRKQATISVQDEFAGRTLPPGLEESLSPQLKDLFDRTRMGVRRATELYITTCNIMDRLVKRGEGVANDHARMALSLHSLAATSTEVYATDTNLVPLLNDGLVAMSKHLRTGQSLMEDEARAWDAGVLEDLKRQRDALVGLRDLFDRRERLDRDSIPLLEKRIERNEAKLATLRAKHQAPETAGQVKPGDIERVVEAIVKDKESIVEQHNRSVFVKECLRDELVYFQATQYHVSRWNQDWAQERVKYSEMLADNWRRLLDELDGMPLGE